MTCEQIVTVTLNPAIDQTVFIPGFASGRVNRVAATECHVGGKGVNVASCLADLGMDVTVTGFLGGANAELFEALFARKGMSDCFVRFTGHTRTGIKIVDEQAGETTDINFPGVRVEGAHVESLLDIIEELATVSGRWFILSGSVPPCVPVDIYARMMAVIHGKGGRVALDTSGDFLRNAMPGRPDVVKPNVDELAEWAGSRLDTLDKIRAAGTLMLSEGVRLVVISMGEAGALFLEDDKAVLASPPKVHVSSTVGAGDAMLGGVICALCQGHDLERIARMGTACGAYSVTHPGSGIEDKADLDTLLRLVTVCYL